MPLVLYGFTIQRDHFKSDKILCFNMLGKDRETVVGRIGRIIGKVLPVIKKLNEPGIFNAPAFVFRDGKNHSFGYAMIGMETHLII